MGRVMIVTFFAVFRMSIPRPLRLWERFYQALNKIRKFQPTVLEPRPPRLAHCLICLPLIVKLDELSLRIWM